MSSYLRPGSNFMRLNALQEVPLMEDAELAEIVIQGQRAAQIARAPPSALVRGARLVNRVFDFGFGRVLSGTNVQAALVGLAGLSFVGNIASQYRLDEYRKRKREREGYKILSSEGVKEVQPRGDESLSKYTEYKPMEKLKQKIEEINPTPVRTENPAMTITPKNITSKSSTPPPKIYVTPEPDEPDQPREPPQIIAQPVSQPLGQAPTVQPVQPSQAPVKNTKGRGKRPVIPPTASPTMSPPLPPPTTTPPPTTQSTTTQQTLTSQLNRDRGLYMGSKPVRPIHGYRVPNNRPYNLVGWERGARAKALLIVQ